KSVDFAFVATAVTAAAFLDVEVPNALQQEPTDATTKYTILGRSDLQRKTGKGISQLYARNECGNSWIIELIHGHEALLVILNVRIVGAYQQHPPRRYSNRYAKIIYLFKFNKINHHPRYFRANM